MRKVHSFKLNVRRPAPTSFEVDGRTYTLYFGTPPPDTPATPDPEKPAVIRVADGTAIDAGRSVVTKIPEAGRTGNASTFELNFQPGAGIRFKLPNRRITTYIVAGDWTLDDPAEKLSPGDIYLAPRGHAHTLRCGAAAGKALVTSAPGGAETFFAEIARLPASERILNRSLEHTHGIALLPRVFKTKTASIDLIELPPAEFMMGTPADAALQKPDELPQHRVRITKGFAIGKVPITKEQFKAFVDDAKYVTEGTAAGHGSTGLDLGTGQVETRMAFSWQDPGFPQTDTHPVTCVSHKDAIAYCEWLSKKEKKTFRLPTEAEWEYACRAGTTGAYYNGDDPAGAKAIANVADESLKGKWAQKLDPPAKMEVVLHSGDKTVNENPMPKGTPLPPYAQPWDDGHPFTAPVGSFQPNDYGLFDTLGQVGEWCLDWYDDKYYARSVVEDPKGPDEKDAPLVKPPFMPTALPLKLHVVRGGVWLDGAPDCRSADRQTALRHPVQSAADIGFRIVMELP